MTIEEKKRYLNGYAFQLARIERFELLSQRSDDKRDEYNLKLREAKKKRDKIEDEIESIDDELEAEVLSQKYLCGKSLGQTAEMLNYSSRHIQRVYRSALKHLKIS